VTTNPGAVRRATRAGVLALLLAAATGCPTVERLYNVSGTAKYKGKPIPAGIIDRNIQVGSKFARSICGVCSTGLMIRPRLPDTRNG